MILAADAASAGQNSHPHGPLCRMCDERVLARLDFLGAIHRGAKSD